MSYVLTGRLHEDGFFLFFFKWFWTQNLLSCFLLRPFFANVLSLQEAVLAVLNAAVSFPPEINLKHACALEIPERDNSGAAQFI